MEVERVAVKEIQLNLLQKGDFREEWSEGLRAEREERKRAGSV